MAVEGGASSARWRGVAGGFVGVVLLGWFGWTVDWVAVGATLGGVRVAEFGVACAAMMLSHAAHAARYGVLVGHIAPQAGPLLLWDAVVVGQAGNTLLPLRAGNVLRPIVVARHTGAALPALLFSTLAELLCDAFGILTMLAGVVLLLPPDHPGLLGAARGWATPAAVALVAVFFGVLFLGTRRARRAALWASRVLPSRRARRLSLRGFEALVVGLMPIGRVRRLVAALFWTLVGWAAWVVAIVAAASSISLDVAPSAALALVCALALAMTIPQAPGFLGGFQVVTVEVLGAWGAPDVAAEAMAVLLWVAFFLPVTLVGLEAAWRRGVRLSQSRAP